MVEACATRDVSVIVCAYTVARWPDLQRAVASVLRQEPAARDVIVVVDHNAELLELVTARWAQPGQEMVTGPAPTVRVLANREAPGLSGARNTGVEASSSEIVAFLDDDAAAEDGWLAALLAPYSQPHVAGCGGAAVAVLDRRPPWWPLEFDWVVGCSYLGLPTSTAPVRNLIGANMSVRRQMVLDLGGFAVGIGRVGTRPVGCEETDLFIRLAQRWPRAILVYEPTAVVRHTVPAARLSWRYFRARCFAEGLSKASVAARVGSDRALASERSYAVKTLPLGVARGVLGACRREQGAGLQALAITAGLTITGAGYVWGNLGIHANRMRLKGGAHDEPTCWPAPGAPAQYESA